jgi:hypothetical protein
MAKDIDHTKNMSGPGNRPPPLPYRPGPNEALVDGFIKDGWIDHDLRWQEVCALYQGQAAADHRRQVERQDRESARRYAEGWVERFMDDNCTVRGLVV